MSRTQLAVWGDPIAHSKSPLLHSAAYRALGLDWAYGRQQVDAARFTASLAGLDDSWRGLSLTMPLKEQAFQAAATHDHHAVLTGAVNTLLFGDSIHGFNTDVGGIIDALSAQEVRAVSSARILGAGATASSALVAAHELGATRVDVRARRPERAAPILALGKRLELDISVTEFDEPVSPVDVTIATLPSGTALLQATTASLASTGGALLDAAYAPWPSQLANAWQSGPVISGLAMLFNQAVRQVRIFVHGDPHQVLERETHVRDVMESALMGD